MIYESPIELINHYSNIDKIDDIATVLFESDDDMFYDEKDREECRPEAIPRIAKAIRSLPEQLRHIKVNFDAFNHQIALVPLHTYATKQIKNNLPLGSGDEWTYELCRKWSTYCFDVPAMQDIDEYLSYRPAVTSLDELQHVDDNAWNTRFSLGTPEFIPAFRFATAPVIIEDGLDENDEIEAAASIIDVIALYGFNLQEGDEAKKQDIHKIEMALTNAENYDDVYDARDSIQDIMKAHGLTPKPEAAIERDNAIHLDSVWREFAYETKFVRNVIAPITDEIYEMAHSAAKSYAAANQVSQNEK